MKQVLAALIAFAVGMPLSAQAEELSAQLAEEVLAYGEVIWTRIDSANMIVRYDGSVFVCEVGLSSRNYYPNFNPNAVDGVPARSIEVLRENPFTASIFDERFGEGAANAILGDAARERYVEINCWGT